MVPIQEIQCNVICLKGDERNKGSLKSLPLVFPNTFKFEAVNGKSIPDKKIKELVSEETLNNIRLDYSKFKTQINSKGQVGCSLSHHKLWEKCVSLNKPLIVAEGDVVLDESKAKDVRRLYENIPDKAVFAALSHLPTSRWFFDENTIGEEYDDFWYTIGHDFSGTQLYYITPYAAKKLLEKHIPIRMPVDIYILNVGMADEEELWLSSKPELNPYKPSEEIAAHLSSVLDHKLDPKKLLPESNNFYVFGGGVFIAVGLLCFWLWWKIKKKRLIAKKKKKNLI